MAFKADLSPFSIIVRRSTTIESEVDGEVVALNIDKGECYGLNRMGSHIWKMLAVPRSVDQICNKLLEEYNVDRPTCESQVLELLDELLHYDLVETLPAAGRAGS